MLGAVVFDMDGLLLDSERLDRRLWQLAAHRRGLALPDAVHAALAGRREDECLALLAQHFGSEIELASRRDEVDAAWQDQVLHDGIPLKAGVERILNLLDTHGILKAIATSTGRAKALQSLGPLAGRLDAIACGDEVPNGKPAPDVYLRAGELLSVAPERCLALEDSINGYRAASDAGMIVIMVPDLLEAPADVPYVCSSLDGIAAGLARALACRPRDTSSFARSSTQ